jgi:NTP pyrophosphatase (non-canonical NTP hydrolase)
MSGSQKASIYLLFTVLFFASTFFIERSWAIQNAENADVQDLLYQAREQAVGLDKDADTMETFVRSDLDWRTHAAYLDQVKEHINNLGKIVEKLQAERGKASPWQQQTIDRSIPLLQELATNTTNAINHLNQNQIRPVSGDYPTWLRENAETAHELASLISDTIEYGRTRSRLQKLEEQLTKS